MPLLLALALAAPPGEFAVTADTPYLLVPVKQGAGNRKVALAVGGQVVREFDAELSATPDGVAAVDVRAYAGRPVTVRVPAADRAVLPLIRPAAAPPAAPAAAEGKRPLLHFTARRGWLNDPNGLVYLAGEWHLFFQHNPLGTSWGNMHWGHAVSADLVHWTELPVALTPPRYGDWAFSGSAVVDAADTAGFGAGALVAAFTSTGRGECITVSRDRGRTWAEYAKNPVVTHAGRDPKLLWHAPTKRWVMAVYDERDGGKDQGIAFYSAADLKSWRFESRTGGFFECPDLVELPLAGKPGETRWVLSGADGKYLVGAFDGKAFTPEGGKQTLWHGAFYAAQTVSNAPAGRCVQIGWARGIDTTGLPYNQQMNVPVELTLTATTAGPRLVAAPVPELAAACGPAAVRENVDLTAAAAPLSEPFAAANITVELAASPDAVAEVTVRGVVIRLDAKAGTLTAGTVTAPAKPAGGRWVLRIVADRQSVEVFTPDGTAVAVAADPAAPGGLSARAATGTATVTRAAVATFK